MSSLIANKVKTNMCLISIKLFIVRTIYVSHCFQLIQQQLEQYLLVRYSSHKTIRYSSYTYALLSTNNYYNGDLQTTTVLFTRNFT